MSNISFDIEAVRRSLAELRVRFTPSSVDAQLVGDALSTITRLSMENERLKAELLASGEGANAVDCELGKVMRERDEAHKCLRWAHDTLYEINPSNYDHDEVCRLNDASVEVILGIALLLGEKHGKTEEWWAERRMDADAAATIHPRDRSKPSDLEKRFKMYQSIAHARHNETMRVAELIAQAVCEAESDEALDALVDLARKVLKI